MRLLTSLPSYSPSRTGSQTLPADPPSGYISGRPSLRLHGNQARRGAAHPSSGGTNSVAHNHSVSEGYRRQAVSILIPLATLQSNFLSSDKESVIGVRGSLTFNMRPFAPALKLPVKRHIFTVKQLQ